MLDACTMVGRWRVLNGGEGDGDTYARLYS